MRDIRDCIGIAIENQGFKKSEIARKIGLTPMQLTDVIKKRRKLEANEFLAICDVIRMGPQDIRSYAETQQEKPA